MVSGFALSQEWVLRSKMGNFKMTLQGEILSAIVQERNRQDARFGRQPRNKCPEVYLTVLMEEVGEVAKALLEADSANYPIELAQVAAVCIAALEDFYQGNPIHTMQDVCGVVESRTVLAEE